ncbi:MAG: hypothetical protein QOF02_4049 [Blastocatellia bacterium]|jgi:hypothetical protein|nr:hypothetical protein [Blastocatellia bacterium]
MARRFSFDYDIALNERAFVLLSVAAPDDDGALLLPLSALRSR